MQNGKRYDGNQDKQINEELSVKGHVKSICQRHRRVGQMYLLYSSLFCLQFKARAGSALHHPNKFYLSRF